MSLLTDTKAMLPKARALVIEHQRGSISLVQRYLQIGYNAASELLEMLEREGTVGPIEGAGGRKVLIERGSTAANGSQKPDDAPQFDAPKLAIEGAAKRPRGRPVVAPEDRLEVITVRLSLAQREKFAALGDGEWLRKQIERAKVKE